jgi:hypothetical protein
MEFIILFPVIKTYTGPTLNSPLVGRLWLWISEEFFIERSFISQDHPDGLFCLPYKPYGRLEYEG